MNIEKLNELSIYELRNYARTKGVHAPTKLKKEELISQINDINAGKLMPQEPSKRGRPHKQVFGSSIETALIPDNLQDFLPKFNETTENIAPITFNETDYDEPYDSSDGNFCKGYLEILNDGNGILKKSVFVKSDMPIYVKATDIVNLNLKDGDDILCKSIFVDLNKPMLAKEIVSINGVSVDEWDCERNDFSAMPQQFLGGKIELEENQILREFNLGDNIYMHLTQKDALQKIVSLSKLLTNFELIYVNPSLIEKDKMMLKTLQNVTLFTAEFDSTETLKCELIALCVNRCKRLVEMNKNVILLIDDVCSIASLDNCDLVLTKKLLTLSCVGSGSLTTIANMPNEETLVLQSKVLNTFKKLEDKSI